ncbi:protein NRT1/ PTR FAMILY 8.3-like [Abrus precatorius]|uniref:Protein NRT1/ PTR FAMILY 8.3-like n=1 Tax=Abrus precatorius TaxID=3816 RepID=A0A8B8KHK2_ABRPR|nr:protein NRT1/ PTR FAMILY 8.3-like [Abrus precatorius]
MEPLDELRSLLEDGLLQSEDCLHTGDGSVNNKGELAFKKETGTWKACPFIQGTFFCERLAYYGIASNLVTHLTTKLHEGVVSAARNVTTFQGTCYLTPLIGSFFADAYWGRYWTIAVFYGIYLIGICILTLSATIPTLEPMECVNSVCPSATSAQRAVFYYGLFFIALGTGGIKPCIWPFGADQFDDTDHRERASKGSFFNWNYFTSNIGALISVTILVWIEENVGWGLGYGIVASFVGIAIIILFLGTPVYRFQRPGGSPLTRISQVVAAALCKWKLEVPQDSNLLYEIAAVRRDTSIEEIPKLEHSNGLRFLDKAAVISDAEKESGEVTNPWRLCTVTQVEELKILIRIFPIWATGIIFCAVYAQMSSLFVEQGKMMDTTVGYFTIPAASLSTFDIIRVTIWVAIYDRGIVPIARKLTGKERGFSILQRMGIGLFLSIICMSYAAFLESKRLQMAKDLGLFDEDVPVPLSILWQIPQYFLLGAAEVFTFVGQHEFFYEQAPNGMRSFCSALALLTNSIGNYLSSLILIIIDYLTTKNGNCGWIADNLNEGHLDYFFWLLAALSFLNMVVYIVYARWYKPKKAYHRSFPQRNSLFIFNHYILIDSCGCRRTRKLREYWESKDLEQQSNSKTELERESRANVGKADFSGEHRSRGDAGKADSSDKVEWVSWQGGEKPFLLRFQLFMQENVEEDNRANAVWSEMGYVSG